MRKPSTSAFTLVEMLTVLAIIVILTSLVVSVGGYVQKKSALARATGEISMLVSACESYKGDNGNYPRDIPVTGTSTSVTDLIFPKVDFVPTTAKYAASSLFLYKELSGDKTGGPNNKPDGIPDDGQPRYLKDVQAGILKVTKQAGSNNIASVDYLKDPFGFPYAYSTAAAKDEQAYQAGLLTNPLSRATAKRTLAHGFNAGSFDLWSTGGDTKGKGPDVWVKNW